MLVPVIWVAPDFAIPVVAVYLSAKFNRGAAAFVGDAGDDHFGRLSEKRDPY